MRAGAGRATEQLALPAGIAPDAGGLTVELASTALVGLGEGARYVVEYPYQFTEARASRALTLLLTSDVGGAFRLPGMAPDRYRAEARSALNAVAASQCDDGGFVNWPGACRDVSDPYLTAYVLHVMHVAGLGRAWQATQDSSGTDPNYWWRRGGFDHVERHDDRVVAFATRLGSGRHDFTYLVRATTAGTFTAAGARMEAIYAPELAGRSAAATIVVR